MIPLHIAIHGATGRNGVRLVTLIAADPTWKLVAAVASPGSRHLGRDAGEVAGVGPLGVAITDALPFERIDAVIDFSSPAGTLRLLPECVGRKLPLLVATTGFEPHERERVQEAGHETPLLVAANTSLVVALLLKMTTQAATVLHGRGFDVEILERHHRFKKDAPSGTALQLARAVQDAQGTMPLQHGRNGAMGERPAAEIGVHAIRVGDNVGEHTVIFGALGETLELTQRAHTRDAYARGALQAARWLVGRGAGWYSMADVLGL